MKQELRINTTETGFLSAFKAEMQYFCKKTGFSPNSASRTQNNAVYYKTGNSQA